MDGVSSDRFDTFYTRLTQLLIDSVCHNSGPGMSLPGAINNRKRISNVCLLAVSLRLLLSPVFRVNSVQ